jgi:hypothetical protein
VSAITMRRPLLLCILLVVAILAGAVYLVSTLIALLFETGLQNAVSQGALNSRLQSIDEAHRPIPKIIHQTWKNETIPEMWSIAQYSCRDLHPDYEYIVASHSRRLKLTISYGPMRRAGSLSRKSTLGFSRLLIGIRIISNEQM